MMDVETFLTTLYISVDDFCKTQLAHEPVVRPTPALSRSEVVTFVVFGQWVRFSSERDFYRWAAKPTSASAIAWVGMKECTS